MTEKELRRISRAELLGLLVEVTEENERLTAELAQQLEKTEAAGYLKEAQGIADQIISEAKERARQMTDEAQAQVDRMIEEAGRRVALISGEAAQPAPGAVEPVEAVASAEAPDKNLDELMECFSSLDESDKDTVEESVIEESATEAEAEAEVVAEAEAEAEAEVEAEAEAEAEVEAEVAAEAEAEDATEEAAAVEEAEAEDMTEEVPAVANNEEVITTSADDTETQTSDADFAEETDTAPLPDDEVVEEEETEEPPARPMTAIEMLLQMQKRG